MSTSPVLDLSSDTVAAVVDRAKLPAGCAWQDDGSVLITLSTPVAQTLRSGDAENTNTLTSLLLSPLTAGDMMDAMDQGKLSAQTRFLLMRSARLAGATGEALIRKMDARDFVRASGVIGVFTDAGQTTGP